MLYYYVQDLYQKNHLGTISGKRIRGYSTVGRELEIGTLLLDNDKNNVIAYKLLSYL